MSATSNTATAFDAVLVELTQPFDPEAVEFKAGAVTQDKARALALAYVDSRVYQARLDAVAPDWRNEYTREYAGDRVIITCALTVAGVTRQAIGESLQASARHDGSTVIEENAATSAEAQAFKRACSAFGLGRYLYSVPQVWAEYDAQRRQFTPAAVLALREMLRTGKYEPAAGHNGNPHTSGAQSGSASSGNGSGNSAAAQHGNSNGNGAATGEAAADTPACPKCGGAMWDNRASKKNPRAPDFKCKLSDCDGVIWPAKQLAAPPAAPAASPQTASGSAVPF
jgi:hypothetical protein